MSSDDVAKLFYFAQVDDFWIFLGAHWRDRSGKADGHSGRHNPWIPLQGSQEWHMEAQVKTKKPIISYIFNSMCCHLSAAARGHWPAHVNGDMMSSAAQKSHNLVLSSEPNLADLLNSMVFIVDTIEQIRGRMVSECRRYIYLAVLMCCREKL